MSIRDRGRLSRWASAAFFATVLSLSNFFAICCLYDVRPRAFAVPPLVEGCLLAGAAVGPPAALVLAAIACWDIRRRPYLGGMGLVAFCFVFGGGLFFFELIIIAFILLFHFSRVANA